MTRYHAEHSTDRLPALVCWTGQDKEGRHWNVVQDEGNPNDAVTDALLIARLLNWYYMDYKYARELLDRVQKAITYETEQEAFHGYYGLPHELAIEIATFLDDEGDELEKEVDNG